jgi:hypothetical protein
MRMMIWYHDTLLLLLFAIKLHLSVHESDDDDEERVCIKVYRTVRGNNSNNGLDLDKVRMLLCCSLPLDKWSECDPF